MTEACLTFQDLTLGYGSHPAVHHLSGSVRQGSLTALVGANGSGKSTLMKGIVGILKPMSGAVHRGARSQLAYLPQQSELDRSFPARVVDLVSLGLWPRRGLLGRLRPGDRSVVEHALVAVGMEGFEKRPLDTLSGGQLQRALFARVLVQDADLILLDEPFNAVDTKTVGDLVELIKEWHRQGRTVMVVVHDLDLVRQHFPEALLLARGPVAWGETSRTLTPENLQRARRFHEAWDDHAPWCEPDHVQGVNAHAGPADRADDIHTGHAHAGHAHAGHGHTAPAQARAVHAGLHGHDLRAAEPHIGHAVAERQGAAPVRVGAA